MNYIRLSFIVFISMVCSGTINGQSKRTVISSKTEVTYAKKLGTINPLEKSKLNQHDYNTEKLTLKRDFKKPKNFATRFPNKIINKELEHCGTDKVRQTQILPSKRRPIETVLNIEGQDTGSSPQDPSGDIGTDFYVQAINNTRIGIYSREGVLLEQFRTNNLWSEFNITPGGDPIILYDQEAERWTITEFPFGRNLLLVAVSQTSDPRGDYNVYSFSTPTFPDYPKYSIWSDAYVLTTNEEGFGDLHVYFLNREELLQGADNVTILRTSVDGPNSPEQLFIVATPVDWSGSMAPPADSNPMVLSLADASWSNNQSQDLIRLNSFDIDWVNENAVATLTEIPVSPYDSNPCSSSGVGFQCIPQKNGGGLDGLPEIITFQPHYRNFDTHEAMVFNFVTDATDGNNIAGLRWIELRRTPGTEWSLHQEGTFAPDDDLHRFMGSVALDGMGNIGMAYSTSSSDTYASLRYTGRLEGDPLGIMTLPEQVAVEGTGTISAGGRFGDYPHITIDPIDDRTFWFTSEYAKGNSSSTRILAFQVAKQEFDLSPTTLIQPNTSPDLGANESVQVIIENLGLNPISSYSIGYEYKGQPKIEEVINVEIAPDETYEFTFSQSLDASEIGKHNLSVFTSYIQDNLRKNDTIHTILEKQAKLDLGVFDLKTAYPKICGTESELTYVITNMGADSILNAAIQIKVNGIVVESFDYNNGLGSGQSVELAATINDLNNGNNSIEISISSPNGLSDEVPNNNIIVEELEVTADSENVILELLTDNFPQETSWELLDESGQVVASSNGTIDTIYEEVIISNFCLDPDQCYTFVIYDDVGDGLTSFLRPSGSYLIYDEDGNVFAGILNENFGTEEKNSFCVDYECNLEIDILTESDQGGTIIIEVTNGAGPVFQYSIDGGMTFTDSNIFENLGSGNYEIAVKDDYGCLTEETIFVNSQTSIKKINENAEIKIYPNPTKGVTEIEITGLESEELWIPIQVYNSQGKKIQSTTVANYSGNYRGVVSLYHHPNGTYFFNIKLKENSHLLKVQKI